MTIIEDRLTDIENLTLEAGAHGSWEDGACLLEAVSYVAGEEWTDHPHCASPTIAAFLRSWHDRLDNEGRQQLKPYITRLVGTRGIPAQEDQRAWMAADWLIHHGLPLWLDAAGMTEQAITIRALPEVTDLAAWRSTRTTVCPIQGLCWDRRRAWRQDLEVQIRKALEKNKAVGAAEAAVATVAVGAAVATVAVETVETAVAVGAVGAAGAADGNKIYWAVRSAVRAKIRELVQAKLEPTVQGAQASANELLERMLAVTA